jgi:hypothetical protein
MPHTRPLTCPRCYHALPPEALNVDTFPCPYCATPIRFFRFPVLVAYIIAFIASLLIAQLVGLKAYQAPLWIPIFVLCFLFAARLTGPLFPPLTVDAGRPVKSAVERNLVLFLAFWFGLIVTILGYGIAAAVLGTLFGGSRRDVLEITNMWSIPLGVINPAFVIRPEKSFVAAMGIVSANCYFWALGLTLLYKAVHHLLRRNRVTELGLSRSTLDDDDEA